MEMKAQIKHEILRNLSKFVISSVSPRRNVDSGRLGRQAWPDQERESAFRRGETLEIMSPVVVKRQFEEYYSAPAPARGGGLREGE